MSRAKRSDLVTALFAEVAKEAVKRRRSDQLADKAAGLRALLMPCQVELERDPAKRISVRAARRTGKSTGVLLIVAIRCLEAADAHWVVVGLTRPSIKRIYWAALKRLNQDFELGIKFQHQELIARFPNGSQIDFTGAEDASEIEKLRGGKYNGVVIDECKSFPAVIFEELITDVIEPALMDRRGQLFVIGTPGDVLAGPFYLATCEEPVVLVTADGKRLSNAPYGSQPEFPALWSLHPWTLKHNTTRFVDSQTGETFTLWDEARRIKREKGWDDKHPSWRREYLGHWVANDNKIVYRYRPHVHDYLPCADTRWGLPGDKEATWRSMIGVDLGSKDGTAMVVWAWSPTEPGLWELYSERRTRDEWTLNARTIAAWYKELEAEYGPFDGAVCDPAGMGELIMNTLGDEYQVYLEPAEKTQKNDHIELFNTDLDAGLIHIRKGSRLGVELLADRWAIPKTPPANEKRKEDPAIPNDTADAGLYGWRWCEHRRAKRVTQTGPAFGTPEWHKQVAASELQAAIARAMKRGETQLDGDWWEER